MNSTNIKKILSGIQKDVLLAPFTTFQIGGLAKYFFVAHTREELIKAVLWARKEGLPFFVLGGGSNVLVSDKGFRGLVIKIKNQKGPYGESLTAKIKNTNQKLKIIEVEAGILLSEVLTLALKNNLTGLEWAAGIPGTVGGAIRGDAGAFGKSMADITESVTVLEIPNHKFQIQNSKSTLRGASSKIQNYKKEDYKFGYRDSIFTRNSNLIILSAELQLQKGKKSEIEKRIKEHLTYRKQTQPLQFPSAGSIFKNQKSKIKNQKLLTQFPELKKFNKEGIIPAGFLIEKAGLKGKRIGRAQISEKHANFIVNLGGAQAKDVIKLIKLIKKEVKNRFGIALEEEIKIIHT